MVHTWENNSKHKKENEQLNGKKKRPTKTSFKSLLLNVVLQAVELQGVLSFFTHCFSSLALFLFNTASM